MNKRDYYDILGIGKDASADEIKKAFRKLAVKYHPDKEGGDEAKFKEINEAYEVLKDPSKRQRYDQFGHAGVGNDPGAGGNPFGGGFGGFDGQNINFDFGNLGDLFGDLGSMFGGGRGQQRQTRGNDIQVALELTFEEAVFGVEKDISLTLDDECGHCHGTRTEPGYELKTCDTCKGSGQIQRVLDTPFGPLQQLMTCQTCEGRGKIPEKMCTVCHGRGVERKHQQLKLKIPAGIDDGATIRLREKGEAVAGGPRGDLYVSIRVKPHKKFTREGELILSEESVDMVTAALGGELKVGTVDGELTMKIPAGTQSGTDFKLPHHGVPRMRGSGRGDHIVTIHVETPTKLSKKQKELLQEFAQNGKHGLFS